jgi:hypothetical protein
LKPFYKAVGNRGRSCTAEPAEDALKFSVGSIVWIIHGTGVVFRCRRSASTP